MEAESKVSGFELPIPVQRQHCYNDKKQGLRPMQYDRLDQTASNVLPACANSLVRAPPILDFQWRMPAAEVSIPAATNTS